MQAAIAAIASGAPVGRLAARLIQPGIARQLLDRSRDQLRVDVHRARALADAVVWIAQQIGDDTLAGQGHRARANAIALTGHNQEAIDEHERALALLEAVGDGREVARTLNAMVQPLILLGQYDKALAAAGRARVLFSMQGDLLRLARLQINVGNILHRQDRFTEALECYEQALADLAPLQDVDGTWSALHNRAVTLISLNRFQAALADYQRARELCLASGRTFGIAQADYNIAWLHYLRGEYSRSIDLLHAAAATAKDTGDAYHGALCLLDLSEIYLELNLSEDARETAERAIARFRELGNGYELAKATANCAIALGQQGKCFRAVELFVEARELFVAEQNRVWPSLVDLYQALLLFNEGRLFEARRLALAAVEVFYVTGLPAKAALGELLLARIDLRLGDPAAAQRTAQRTLDAVGSLDTPILLYHAWFTLGQAQAAVGDPGQARVSYERARDALETLRSRVRGEELKIAFVRNKVAVYEHLVTLAIDDAPDEPAMRQAFLYVEQAKSRTLLDLIFQPVHALARAEGSESELARSVRHLRDELNWYYHLIEIEQLQPGPAPRARLTDLQAEAGQRERELARVVRDLSASASPEAELHAPTVCSVDEVRQALPADTVLVEFFEAQGRIVACLLDHQSIHVVPVTVTARVGTHLRMLQFQLSKFRLGSRYLEMFGASLMGATRLHLSALFQELLAPVWPRLRGRALVVVPHGLLHYVPFHALWTDDDGYVVDACRVSYAPSGTLYARCQALPSAAARDVLVMGVADERAPSIEHEARQVASMFADAHLCVGAAATAAVLRASAPTCRIVHLAAHGEFRPDNPMFSAIRLGDGRLNVYDLYRLRMPADLVTLSGCATGANMAAAGDELLGITRGLFLAGARTLMLSLWDVHDQRTASLMTEMYRRIVGGASPADALRDAMLAIREEAPHPFYWAPFILSGKCATEKIW